MSHNDLQPWKLLSAEDVSPSPWFPLEKRQYELPDGATVDDFYVTTLADSVHVLPVTPEGKLVMIQMYKPGADAVMTQWPAGRYEPEKHESLEQAAVQELKEETGIVCQEADLKPLNPLVLQSTKGTERVVSYVVTDVMPSERQQLDVHEEIVVVHYTPGEIDRMILAGDIWDAPCIALWYQARLKYPELLCSS